MKKPCIGCNSITYIRHGDDGRPESGSGNALKRSRSDSKRKSAHELRHPSYPRVLTPKGILQVEATREWLRGQGYAFHAHYVSIYPRSIQTARIIYPDTELFEDERLVEKRDGNEAIFADPQIFTAKQIKRFAERNAYLREKEGRYHYRSNNGDSRTDIAIRLHNWFTHLDLHHTGEDVCAITHQKVIGVARKIHENRSHFEFFDPKWRDDFTQEHASVTRYERVWDGRLGRSVLKLKFHNIVPWKNARAA